MGLLDFLPKSQKSGAQSQGKAKILLAEDEKYLNDFYVELLTSEGYEVHSAYNGQQALDIIKNTPIHLAILDINMPVMNGDQVLVQLRKNDTTKDLPVIILTNAGTVENLTYTRVHHATKFFIKSDIEPPTLLEAIKTLLNPQTGS